MTTPVCGAKTRAGAPCQRQAGWGTDHFGFGRCANHLGATQNHAKAAAVEMARAHVAAMGGPVHLEPHDALEWAIAITAGEVRFYDQQIARLADDQIAGQATVRVDRDGTDDEGNPTGSVEVRQLAPALHVWVQARAAAVDRMARFAKSALDADIDERRTRLLEQQADAMAVVWNAVMADLVANGLPNELRALAGDSFRRHIALLDVVPGTATEVTA
jgi:hypothetical protein